MADLAFLDMSLCGAALIVELEQFFGRKGSRGLVTIYPTLANNSPGSPFYFGNHLPVRYAP